MYKFIFILFLITKTVSAQSKKDIQEELKFTKAKLDSFQTLYFQQQILLQQKVSQLESIIDKAKFVLNYNIIQPQIITTPTIVPSIEIQKTNLENNKSNSPIKLNEGDGLTPKTGARIYTGPRGGQYYINKNGNKTYIKK